MSEHIDALAVIRGMADPANDFHSEAISAISELIQIAQDFDEYNAQENGDISLLDQEVMWARLSLALDRLRGSA